MQPTVKEIAISELRIGVPLDCDIVDPEGRVLLRRGHVLPANTRDRWLEKGFTKVLLSVDGEDPASDESPPLSEEPHSLNRAYDETLVAEVKAVVEQAQAAVTEMVFDIAVNDELRLSVLQSVFQQLASAIDQDSDVVVCQANQKHCEMNKNTNAALANRCVLLSTLSSATALHLGLPAADCATIATVGMLHDVALFEETLAMFVGERPEPRVKREAMQRHPQHSADLLRHSRDVSDQVRVLITQVHEQIDGSGFPRGIGGHLMSMHSRVINLVDAYLTLTDPNLSQSFVPADALAYLTGQTSRGAFDLDCMRALLHALSVYSVGSQVVLDSGDSALVLRSSRSDPLRPIVRMDDAAQTIVDLRTSPNYISGPTLDPQLPTRRRLRKSELKTVLWKPKYAMD